MYTLNEELSESNISLRSLNKELVTAKKKAEESDHLKSSFLANMSHEIRTPLNGIVGFTQLLVAEDLEAEKKELYQKIIHKCTDQLLNIISDIIDISKLDSDQLDIYFSEFDIRDVIESIVQHFRMEAENKKKQNIQIIVKPPLAEDNTMCYSDEFRLRQILSNLVSNALKFTEKGYIEIGYKRLTPEIWQFYVKDTGIGIDPKNQKIIFDRFRQADESHTRKFGGTGLGLSICKKLTELLNGNIEVESTLGEGSIFSFTISTTKVGKIRKNEAKSFPVITKTDRSRGKCILIVEDTLETVELNNEIFNKMEFDLRIAKNGSQALNILKKKKIDLIIMDIQLPDISGYDLTAEIKGRYPDVPIIAHTAHALAGDKEKAMNSGCDDYLAKPVNIPEFKSIIEKYL